LNSKSGQVYVTLAVMVLAPFFFGSVDLFWISIWTIILSIGALFGIFVPLKKGQARVLLALVSLCGVYGAVAIVQIVPHAFDGLNDLIWQKSSEILGTPALPRISSHAEIPPLAIGHVLLFAVAFINGLCIGTSRRDSERIVRCAQYFILAFAVYGFAALFFTPNLLIWANKTAYLGYLTGTFVNHNTAATLLGAGGILWFCSAFSAAQSVSFESVRTILLSRSNESVAVRLIFRSSAALVCFAALLQTGSRGGLICSVAGLLGAIVLMLAKSPSLRPSHAFSVLAAALVVCFLVLGRTGRIASQGLIDEGRWSVYQLAFEAIKRRPLFGSGAGTFADQFAAFRSSDLSSWGVWDYAHSSILEIAVEMGIPVALMIAVSAFVSVYILARAAVFVEGQQDQRMLAAIAGIAILTYLHSLIDFSLQIPGYLIVFGVLLGCGLSRATSDQLKPVEFRIPRAKRSQRI
jgi:O-antigen ligase